MTSAHVYDTKSRHTTLWIRHQIAYSIKIHIKQTQSLNVIKKQTSNKMALVKFIFNVWENEIVSMLSKVHGTRWLRFDGTGK